MELQLPKGTRDFSPEEKILRDKVVNTLKEVFELYGFAPLDTPILEKFDVLSSKYAGGAEILKETFKLKDQGARELGLRYDLTVPLARYIGMNPRDPRLERFSGTAQSLLQGTGSLPSAMLMLSAQIQWQQTLKLWVWFTLHFPN